MWTIIVSDLLNFKQLGTYRYKDIRKYWGSNDWKYNTSKLIYYI